MLVYKQSRKLNIGLFSDINAFQSQKRTSIGLGKAETKVYSYKVYILTFHSFLNTSPKRLCCKCDRKGIIRVHSNRNFKWKQIILKLWKPTLMYNVLGEIQKVVHEWVCALSIPTTYCFLSNWYHEVFCVS